MQRIKNYIPALAAIFLIIIGLALSYYQKNIQKEQYRNTYLDVFDTVIQFIGYADSEEEFVNQTDLLKEKFDYYHKLYDIYTSYEGINNLQTINENAGIAPVKVDPEIIELIILSKDMYDKTDGQVNIAMGSVLSIWHDYRTIGINQPENASLPPIEELQEAAKHTNINNIIIDKEASTVYLADPDMSLDVGSIGKGYAVQKVCEYAKELGITNLVINAGGNVCAIGTHADKTNWKFAIQNPDLDSKDIALKTVSVADKCLVTSGDYQRYYMVNDVLYCHIIDPDTLMPANYYSSVSIITDDSGIADALSTALFNMEYEEGLKLINSLNGTEAIWVFKDGSIKYSKHFEDFIIE